MFREIKHLFQKITRGYSDADLWNLDVHLAELILPRLKTFCNEGPSVRPDGFTDEEWSEALNKMIFAFQAIKHQHHIPFPTETEQEKIEEGLQLFGEHFMKLWN